MGAKILKSAALASALGAMLAATPGAAFADGSKPKAAKDDPSRRVCKNVVRVGTRLSTRICRTQAEWARSMDKTQDGHLQSLLKDHTTYSK